MEVYEAVGERLGRPIMMKMYRSRCVRERAAVRGGAMLTVQPVEWRWIHSARAPESIKRLAHSCLSHR